jgi:hypothetical protein
MRATFALRLEVIYTPPMVEPQPSSNRSGAVTAAAVVAAICSGLVLLFALLALFGVSALNQVPPQPGMSPEQFRYAALVGVAFIALFGVWGLVTAVGLFGYRNWARISTLIWSGLTAVFGTLTLLFGATLTLPASPGGPPGLESFARIFVLIFYSIPVAIAVWWLVLFTRKPVVAMFGSSSSMAVTPGTMLDPSGFPAAPPKRQVPVPVTIVGWIFFVSGLLAPLFLLINGRAGVLLFGNLVRGPLATLFWLTSCLCCIAGAFGLLRLKPWAWWLTLCAQLFWLTSGTVTLLSPNYESLMREVIASSRFASAQASSLPLENARSLGAVGLVIPIGFVVILLVYRSSFFQESSQDSVAR